jgi:hypothetical protein
MDYTALYQQQKTGYGDAPKLLYIWLRFTFFKGNYAVKGRGHAFQFGTEVKERV